MASGYCQGSIRPRFGLKWRITTGISGATAGRSCYDKRRRYLLGVGQARYNEGRSYRFGDEWKGLLRMFYFNFKGMKGYKDGLRGLGVSLKEARYGFIACRRLRDDQHAQTALSENLRTKENRLT